ncbi:MAG: hypothetical protein GMKNLPBB_03042 [Myxococcota bacterium]|nr:hypothetical protein [Myxococcota bacterium]
MPFSARLFCLWLVWAGCWACSSTEPAIHDAGQAADGAAAGGDAGPGPLVKWEIQPALPGAAMKLNLAGGFFDRPFPANAALTAEGTIDTKGFPHGDKEIVLSYLQFVRTLKSFSTQGAIYLPFDGALDRASLPADARASLDPNASAFLVCVDRASPLYGKKHPVSFAFKAGEEPQSVPHLLAALPVMGVPLRPATSYALVATSAVKTADGKAIGAPVLAETARWSWSRNVDWTGAPDDARRWAESVKALGDYLRGEGLPAGADRPPPIGDIRAYTVFTTGEPASGMKAIAAKAIEAGPGIRPIEAKVTETFAGYCLIEGKFGSPRWQTGAAPYKDAKKREGRIVFENGVPKQQGADELRFTLTIPKQPMPERGFPLMMYGHGMTGNFRQVIDRGQNFTDGPPDPSFRGSGPAQVAARRGIAAGGLDAVAHGARVPGGAGPDAGLNYFNFFNPWAVRDNTRQTISDYMVFGRMAGAMEMDAAACPGVTAPGGKVRWDARNLFFMGHSLGSSQANVIAAVDPDVRVVITSGAGGAAISFVMSQKSPVDIAKTMASVLGMDAAKGHELDVHDPILTVIQMIFDEADGPNFAAMAGPAMEPSWPSRNVLQLHGLGDTFTPELTANAVAASFGLDAVRGEVDPELPERISFNGGKVVDAPVSGNRTLPNGAKATFVLLSYNVPGAPQINPHYGTFRMESVKHRYGCFLRGFLDKGVPTLPAAREDSKAECDP